MHAASLEVTLVHDGRVIASETTDDSRSGLTVTHSITEEGVYQCFATNEYGCEQWTTLVTFTTSVSTSRCTLCHE